jgi:hypothetical protein
VPDITTETLIATDNAALELLNDALARACKKEGFAAVSIVCEQLSEFYSHALLAAAKEYTATPNAARATASAAVMNKFLVDLNDLMDKGHEFIG